MTAITGSIGKIVGKYCESSLSTSTTHLIKYIANVVDIRRSDTLYREFTNNTRHFENEKFIELTNVMDRNKITGTQLLLSLNNDAYLKNSSKYVSSNRMNLYEAEELVKRGEYIEKFHNIVIKNSFRSNEGDVQVINIRDYDDEHGNGQFYKSFISLLNMNMR